MGKTKKTVFKWFNIPQYTKEEEYLSDMHKKGWRIVNSIFNYVCILYGSVLPI